MHQNIIAYLAINLGVGVWFRCLVLICTFDHKLIPAPAKASRLDWIATYIYLIVMMIYIYEL